MLVSVVIPTKSRPHTIVDAVHSVFNGTYQHFELFVVDQTPDSSTRDALAPFMVDSRFHYLTNRRPGYGAASSRNLGIAASSGDIIAITDDDVEARPDWLERIVAEFTADPALQFISGTLSAPPHDSHKGFVPAFTPYAGITNWRLPWMVSGANVSMRRILLERIGGFDEFCGPGSRIGASDDGDITFRMMRSGAKWKGCPEIEVVHTHGFRPGQDGDKLVLRYDYGNGGIFGRFTRRGDLLAGGWFLVREAVQVLRGVRQMVAGQPSGLEHSRTRLKGFWHGLTLSPHEGFVSGEALKHMHMVLTGQIATDSLSTQPRMEKVSVQ